MEKKMGNEMETGIIMGCIRVVLGFIGIMEKKMETTTMGLGFRVIRVLSLRFRLRVNVLVLGFRA